MSLVTSTSNSSTNNPLFATHFVRDGLNNYAVIQATSNVTYANYVVSERYSTSSTGTTSFSGRVEQPTPLYQWSSPMSVDAAGAAASASDGGAESEAPAAASPASYATGACFTFPLTKGCIYFIQIEFALNTGTLAGAKSNIHWFVDPNKRRIVSASGKKRAALTAAATTTGEPGSALSSTPSSSSVSAAPADASSAKGGKDKDPSAPKKAKKSLPAGRASKAAAAAASAGENPAALEVC